MKSDTICAVPWMHLNIEPDGKVVPCCLTSRFQHYVGDLKNQSLEEIWNSERMKGLRTEMMQGKKPKICSSCWDREAVSEHSQRLNHNRLNSKLLEEIPNITTPDGHCNKMELKYWDFRFSNLCNFKCRSCGSRYSSSWVPDHKKLYGIKQEKVWTVTEVNNLPNYKFLEEQVKYVERIYFAGGEPLMMPEHWRILDMLVENKRFDVEISYNTNASTLTYGNKNVLDYWSKWEYGKIGVWPSIDELGERAELIRSGTNWKKIEENLKEIISLKNITVRPCITTAAWNVARLPEIMEYLIDLDVITKNDVSWLHYKNWFINLLEFPFHYHVSILPDTYRKDVIKKLNNFIEICKLKYNTDLHSEFSQILAELEKPFNLNAAKEFVIVTDQLDEIRNEKLLEVIPEMEVVYNAVKYSNNS